MKKIIFIVLLFGFLFSCGGTTIIINDERSKIIPIIDCDKQCIHKTLSKYLYVTSSTQNDIKYDNFYDGQIISLVKQTNTDICVIDAHISLDYKDNLFVINYHNIKGTYKAFSLEKCKQTVQSFQENFEKNITIFVNKYKLYYEKKNANDSN